jgi:hypothetical protein
MNNTESGVSREVEKGDILKKFIELESGQTMMVPFDKIEPSMPFEGTASHTGGLIEVYHDTDSNCIRIDDGNHRYYNLRFEGYKGDVLIRKVEHIPIEKQPEAVEYNH